MGLTGAAATALVTGAVLVGLTGAAMTLGANSTILWVENTIFSSGNRLSNGSLLGNSSNYLSLVFYDFG